MGEELDAVQRVAVLEQRVVEFERVRVELERRLEDFDRRRSELERRLEEMERRVTEHILEDLEALKVDVARLQEHAKHTDGRLSVIARDIQELHRELRELGEELRKEVRYLGAEMQGLHRMLSEHAAQEDRDRVQTMRRNAQVLVQGIGNFVATLLTLGLMVAAIYFQWIK